MVSALLSVVFCLPPPQPAKVFPRLLPSVVLPAPVAPLPPVVKSVGHWEKRCGPSGCQQVWIADEPATKPEEKSETQTYSRRRWFRR